MDVACWACSASSLPSTRPTPALSTSFATLHTSNPSTLTLDRRFSPDRTWTTQYSTSAGVVFPATPLRPPSQSSLGFKISKISPSPHSSPPSRVQPAPKPLAHSASTQYLMSSPDASHLLPASSRTREPQGYLPAPGEGEAGVDHVWLRVRAEARESAEAEPFLASYMYSAVLAHPSLEGALAFHLANKLCNATLLSTQLKELFLHVLSSDRTIQEAVRADLVALEQRDPACINYAHGLLNYKGYLAIQTYRIAHKLWGQGRRGLALALANRISEMFHVEIHPAARIGKGLLLDHATGVVIGETASIGDNVSMLHDITLGGTGCLGCLRHPQIEQGVLIGAGAKLLGPITVGQGAKIGAGSVVLQDVPPFATVVGNPGRVVGGKRLAGKEERMAPSETMDHADFADWVI